MPKGKKTKKAAKKRAKKRVRKAAKKSAEEERIRPLILALVDRMGGSSAIHDNNPDQIIVHRFGQPPFMVNMQSVKIEDVDLGKSPPPAGGATNVAAAST
jgi:hypothetical protein